MGIGRNRASASLTRARTVAAVAMVAATGTLAGLAACGGTTGREGLPTFGDDSGPDVTVIPSDAATPDLDSAAVDVTILYADRELPDVGTIPDADSDGDAMMDTDALVPCTASHPTHCVQCGGNLTGAPGTDGGNGGLCTPTEAQFVAFDIASGRATAPGPDPGFPPPPPDAGPAPATCYACLLQSGCIDDTVFGDYGFECEDDDAGAGTIEVGYTAAACESVIHCTLGSSCTGAGAGCYCGTAPVATTCQGNPAPGPINGACAAIIAAGLGYLVTDGTDITANYTNTTTATGRANQIFRCAQSYGCTACLQK
jgi:hypothetical protein